MTPMEAVKKDFRESVHTMMQIYYVWRSMDLRIQQAQSQGIEPRKEEVEACNATWAKFDRWAQYFIAMFKEEYKQSQQNQLSTK